MLYDIIRFATSTFSSLLSLTLCSLLVLSNNVYSNDQKADDLTKVYKVVAADGSITFSDQPDDKAETLMVAPVTTVPALSPQQASFALKKPAPEEHTRYQSLTILAPSNDSAFYSGSGDVDIILDIRPALIEGDKIHLYLDGALVNTDSDIQTRIQTVDRGTHELRAKLVSPSGQIYAQAISTFTVHRPTAK